MAQNADFDLRLLAHLGAPESRTPPATTPQRIAVAIGPEGGFSDAEVTLAEATGFRAYTVGRQNLEGRDGARGAPGSPANPLRRVFRGKTATLKDQSQSI